MVKEFDAHHAQAGIPSLVSTPRVNEVVAAKFEQDKKWYRAQVTKVVSRQEIEVFFVDYGNVSDLCGSCG